MQCTLAPGNATTLSVAIILNGGGAPFQQAGALVSDTRCARARLGRVHVCVDMVLCVAAYGLRRCPWSSVNRATTAKALNVWSAREQEQDDDYDDDAMGDDFFQFKEKAK